MDNGSRTSISSQPQLHVDSSEPFISGTFEYGLGRPAAGRKIYLFINKAQDQRNLHDAMVQFLGVYKTNKKASYPHLLSIILLLQSKSAFEPVRAHLNRLDKCAPWRQR